MQSLVNWIVTVTAEGELWHEKSALCCYHWGWRGLARWHEIESCGDEHTRKCFTKYIADNFKILPAADLSSSMRAITYMIPDSKGLMNHLSDWKRREQAYIEQTKEHIARLSAAKHYTLYKMLCDLLCELENELLYVQILCDNLAFGETQHHAAQKMKDLHIYFAEKYDGGRIDFDI